MGFITEEQKKKLQQAVDPNGLHEEETVFTEKQRDTIEEHLKHRGFITDKDKSQLKESFDKVKSHKIKGDVLKNE